MIFENLHNKVYMMIFIDKHYNYIFNENHRINYNTTKTEGKIKNSIEKNDGEAIGN